MNLVKAISILIILHLQYEGVAQTLALSGVVKDAKTRQPLPYCNVRLAGTTLGTTTDPQGKFQMSLKQENDMKIVVSFVGYVTDTVSVIAGSPSPMTILVQPDAKALDEVVVVSGTMKEVTKMSSPIPVEVYSPALFLKNPTPSIFESLSMINGVQPQLNCNVCNTGDIHINGMEGPYTMVLIDGMPIVSSLATVYGLSGIPNSMVKRIEVVKGPASTLYGSEAVGGLINIITKDPATSPLFKADISSTSVGELNGDLSSAFRFGKVQALLGINYFNYQNLRDINGDNFTDVALQNRFSIFNKWDLKRNSRQPASLALRYVYEDRWGGELQWNNNYRGSNEIYGESIYTNRFELIGNYGLPFKNEKIQLDYSYNFHKQDSYYGVVSFQANQHVVFSQLRWDKQLGKHDLLVGIPFRFIQYDDNTTGTVLEGKNHPQTTVLPGIFLQDEYKISETSTLLTGIRYDHHNEHGNIFSPRVSLKVSPTKEHTIRLSAGNGFRVVNLFTEDHAALTGSRTVYIEEKLKPEQSWNVNLNYATMIANENGFTNFDASIFYTYFTNKITGDFVNHPDTIFYTNLNGKAISKGITLNTDFMFLNTLKIIAGVTLMDVYQVDETTGTPIRQKQFFAPSFSGTYTVSYSFINNGITIDFSGKTYGPMRLPVQREYGDQRPDHSPWYSLLNIQVTKTLNNGLEFYGGMKNLLNFVPKDPLLYPETPFSNGFDTSYNYAPVQGLKAFAGIRFTIQ
jgi:outer membrane receptor for ferrienterochelin and colicins